MGFSYSYNQEIEESKD